jgi:hypothetical protein
MANTKISALTSATTPLAGTEVLPIVQSSATVKVATNDLTVRNIRANATTGILQVTGPAAASTRVMTTPDANFTVARTDAAQSFTGDQTLSTGNLVIGTSGKGVDFSVTPGTGTSELLADYEEGTWTPTFTGNGTTGTVTATSYATYTKVGRVVHVQLNTSLIVAVAPTGYLIITLPFARAANTAFCGAVATYNIDLPAGAIGITIVPINITVSANTAILFCSTDDGAGGLVQANLLATTDEINFGFSYIAA